MPADPVETIAAWWSYLTKAEGLTTTRLKIGEKSRAWYEGKEDTVKKDFKDWDGELVRGNLWQRDYDILHDSLWASDPKFSVTTNDPGFDKTVAVMEEMALKVWKETGIFDEMDVCFIQALHDNIGYVKLDYDRIRQLPTVRWCAGTVLTDPNCKGIYRRAAWMSEVLHRPAIDIYTDTSLPQKTRNMLMDKMMQDAMKFDPSQTVKVAYIWSKYGETPWIPKSIKGRKLIIICDKLDVPLDVTDWPWPFIDHDRFPVYGLRCKKVDGKIDNTPLFGLLESLFRHFNWAASINLAGAKREVTKKVLLDTGKIREPVEQNKVESGKMLEIIKGQGIDQNTLQTVDFSTSSDVAFRSAEFSKQLHDEQSGITDVVRGQPAGGRQTAEEVRTLKSNAAIVFQGISQALTRFSDEVCKDFILAVCYYVPAFSRIVDEFGQVWTKEMIDGQMIDAMVDPAELKDIPMPQPPGTIVRAGVDAYLGPEKAIDWPKYDIEQLRRDFMFTIESGSTRADTMIDDQRNALAMLQQLGPLYQQMGMIPQLFELIKRFINSFRPRDPYKLYPQMMPMMPPTDPNLDSQNSISKEPMNMFGANPQKPFGDSGGSADGFERKVAARSAQG